MSNDEKLKALHTPITNYPVNHWWVAALAEEVPPGKLLGRILLGQPVVLYRTQNGQIAALENRCPHRAAPLSLGTLEGDNIGCRYHGMQFGPDGKCAHIPTQTTIPRGAAVKVYPVREIGPLIWIWTGDPALSNVSMPPELPWTQDSSWLHLSGVMPLKANYMSLKENVLDLTHFGYVHASTFQIKGWLAPPEVTVKDGVVRYENRFDGVPLPHLDRTMIGEPLGERPYNVLSWGHSLSPAMHEAGMDARLYAPKPGEREVFTMRILHITTPESPSSTHYWWLQGSDYGQEAPGVREWLHAAITEAFLEDKMVLEAIQNAADTSPGYATAGEVSILADQAGLQTRRQLDLIMEKDQSLCERACHRAV